MWKTLAFLLLFFFAASLSLHAESLAQPNYTKAQTAAVVTNALSYVNETNQSSYLIFSPNLTAAYSYLNKAESLENTSPNGSVFYAQEAVSSASEAYKKIGVYREDSLIAITLFSIAMAVVLYRFMRPVKKRLSRG